MKPYKWLLTILFLAVSLYSQEMKTLLLADFDHFFSLFSEGRGDRGGKGSFSVVSQPTYKGKHSGKFSYDFTGTGEEVGYIYAPINCTLPLPGRPSLLILSLYGDGSQHTFTYRFVDKTGEVFQGTIGAINWKGWREVHLPLTEEATFSWGGNGDHKIDYPISLHQLIIDKTSNSLSLKGAIYIGDIRLQTRDVSPSDIFAMDIKADRERRIYNPGETANLKIAAFNRDEKPLEVALSLRARDFFNTPILEREVTFSLPPYSGKETSLKIPLKRSGAYIVEISPKDNSWRKEIVLSALPPFQKGRLDLDSPFGINGHIPNEQELSMMERAGIRWCRMDFLWEINEPEKDKFNWKTFDEVFSNSRKHAVYPLPILCYNSRWGSRKSENGRGYVPDLTNWLPYVRGAVKRYKDFVRYWEVWNEPNIGFWTGTFEEYAELLKETYKAIKEVDGTAMVVMGGTAGTDLRFIEELYKKGVPFDIVNIHPYGYPSAPESYLEGQINACRELMKKYGDEKKPIWITEYGWPNHIGPSGVDIITQANYIVRAFIIALGAGVEKIFWYDYQNGPDPYYNEHNFGIVYMGDIPKPCYIALSTMTRVLAGKKFLKKLPMPQDCYAYVFQNEKKEEAIVLWALRDKELTFEWKGKGELCDLMGNRKPLSSSGLLRLKLSPSPVFLLCKGDSLPVVAFRWKGDSLKLMPFEKGSDSLIIKIASSITISVFFLAPPGITITPSHWTAKLRKGEWLKTFYFEAQAIPFRSYTITAQVKVGKQTFAVEKTVEILPPYDIRIYPLKGGLKVAVKNLYSQLKGEGVVARLESPLALFPEPSVYFPIFKPGEEVIGEAPIFPAFSEAPGVYPVTVNLEDKRGIKMSYQRKVSFFPIPKAEDNPLESSNPQWQNIPGIILDKREFIQQIKDWKGQSDLWVEGKFTWDEEDFYLYIEVIDDVFFNDFSPDTIWQGDSVQFAIAPRNEHRRDEPFVQIDIAKSKGKDIVYRRAFGRQLKEGEIEAKGKVKLEGNKVLYLFAIPWKELGVKPEKGKSLGFSFLVNDNDGEGRKGWMEWGGGIGWEKNPAQFYDLTLEER